MQIINRFGPLVSRVLIALIFVWSGFGKIAGFAGTVGYIASQGLPLPQLAAIAAIIVELGGGIMLIVGWNARLAKEVEKLEKECGRIEGKLGNEAFVAKAPEAVIAKEREKLADYQSQLVKLKEQQETIKSL